MAGLTSGLEDFTSDEDAIDAFRQFPHTKELVQSLSLSAQDSSSHEKRPRELQELTALFKARGGHIVHYKPGQLIKSQGIQCIFENLCY